MTVNLQRLERLMRAIFSASLNQTLYFNPLRFTLYNTAKLYSIKFVDPMDFYSSVCTSKSYTFCANYVDAIQNVKQRIKHIAVFSFDISANTKN